MLQVQYYLHLGLKGGGSMFDLKNKRNYFIVATIFCIGAIESAAAEGAVMWSPLEYPVVFWTGILWLLPLAFLCKWFFVKEVMERSWSQSLIPLCITQISHLTIGMIAGFFVCMLLVSGWFNVLTHWLLYMGDKSLIGLNQYAWTFWVLYCVVMTATVAFVELMTLKVFYWRSLMLSFKKFALLWGGQAIFLTVLVGIEWFFGPMSIMLRFYKV